MNPAIKTLLTTAILLSWANTSAACFESFEGLFAAIDSDDKALGENSGGFYIEELLIDKDGSLREKRQLSDVPKKYTYNGRIYPSQSMRDTKEISVYVQRIMLKDIRVVTEKNKEGQEPSSYWFWRGEDGCWKLRSRAINVEL